MMYLEVHESTLYKWKGCVIYFGKCFGIEILQPDYLWTDEGRMNVLPITCQASPELAMYFLHRV